MYRSVKRAEHFKYAEGEPSALDKTHELALKEEINRLSFVVGGKHAVGVSERKVAACNRITQLSAILTQNPKNN